MKYIIYLIINNINGKGYVGYTHLTLEQRWELHCGNAKNRPKKNIFLECNPKI